MYLYVRISKNQLIKGSDTVLSFCSDINECQPFKNNCSREADCVNTEGSYACRCRPGYQGDGFTCVCEYLFVQFNFPVIISLHSSVNDSASAMFCSDQEEDLGKLYYR